MFYYPIMASFGYSVKEIVRFHTDFASNEIMRQHNAVMRHQGFEGAAYKIMVRPVLE